MLYLLILCAFLICVFLSSLIIPRILVIAFRKRLFDLSTGQAVPRRVVSRLGGISFVPILVFSLAFTVGIRYVAGYPFSIPFVSCITPEVSMAVCGMILLYLSGIKEDLVGLRYRTKVAIQVLAASFFPLSGVWWNNLHGLFGVYEVPAGFGIPFTILLVVGVMNAVRLLDEITGLASGISSICVGILGALFLSHRLWVYALLAFSTLGVLLPFFYYNVFGRFAQGKKIFMGNAGSQTMGFILSFLLIRYVDFPMDLLDCMEGIPGLNVLHSFSLLIV